MRVTVESHERMQLGRPRALDQPVPGVGADPDDAGQMPVSCPEAD